jgi:hypothetical protein
VIVGVIKWFTVAIIFNELTEQATAEPYFFHGYNDFRCFAVLIREGWFNISALRCCWPYK